VGLTVYYLGEMYSCKQEAMNYILTHKYIRNENLVTFLASAGGFQKLNENEILKNGCLYDIVKIEVQCGKKIYYAVSDDKEDIFWHAVAQIAKENSGAHHLPFKNVKSEVLTYVSNRVITSVATSILFQPYYKLSSNISSFLYQSPIGDIFSPPPQAILS
jgi:hypothetical protein